MIRINLLSVREAKRRVSDNETEAKHKRVLEIIRAAGQISRSDLVRKTQFLSTHCSTKANKWQGRNITRYRNPEYDAVHRAAEGELDPVKRSAMFTQVLQTLYDDAVAAPIIARTSPFAYKTGMAGFAEGSWGGVTWNIANWTRA